MYPLRVSPSRLAVALAGALAADPVLPANSDTETALHAHLIAAGEPNAGSSGVPPRVQNAAGTAGPTQVAVGPGTCSSLTQERQLHSTKETRVLDSTCVSVLSRATHTRTRTRHRGPHMSLWGLPPEAWYRLLAWL